MLALRLVLTEGPPSLVFDEVDAGIGGEAGSAVGRLLADLAPPPPGALRHPPGPGRGARPDPGGGREARGRRAGRWRAAAVVDGDAAGRRSCRGCSPGSASPTTRDATPRSCSNGPPRRGPSRPDAPRHDAFRLPVTGTDTTRVVGSSRSGEAHLRDRWGGLQPREGPHRRFARAAPQEPRACGSRCRSSTRTSTSTPGR